MKNTTWQAWLTRLALAVLITVSVLYLESPLEDIMCGHTTGNQPTKKTTNQPNNQTTKQPNNQPTKYPNNQPTSLPTNQPHYQTYLANVISERPVVPNKEEIFPPNGVLCVPDLGAAGQLNNQLFEFSTILEIGHELNRTVVVSPGTIADVYELRYLMNQPAIISYDYSLCSRYPQTRIVNEQNESGKEFIERFLLPENAKLAVLAMEAKTAFYFPTLKYPHPMYAHLQPLQDTLQLAVNFVEEKFGTEPFVAVHLRFLDGECYRRSKDLACDLDPQLFRQVLKKNAPELLNAPVFVASDRQRPDLLLRFLEAGATIYRGNCNVKNKQCMVVDSEIVARSAYFYGNTGSTASIVMENLRQQRDNGALYEQKPGSHYVDTDIPTLFDGDEKWTRHVWKNCVGNTRMRNLEEETEEVEKEMKLAHQWFMESQQKRMLKEEAKVGKEMETGHKWLGCHEMFNKVYYWIFGVTLALIVCTNRVLCVPASEYVLVNDEEDKPEDERELTDMGSSEEDECA